ncbi:hypothetical protein SAMN04488168_10623 [Bacillus sp. 491mf]|nr:hypothetical protein SAMN04488168_10623 [Bacillus sp. 491mf]
MNLICYLDHGLKVLKKQRGYEQKIVLISSII